MKTLLSRIFCWLGAHDWNYWAEFDIHNSTGIVGKIWYCRCRECFAQKERVLIYDWYYEEMTTLVNARIEEFNGRQAHS